MFDTILKAVITGFLIILTSLFGINTTSSAQSFDAYEYETNRITIQFSEDAVPSLNREMAAEQARTSISSVDALHQELNVISMKQTIRTDPRYAHQHAAYGLDRWYTLEFAADMDIETVVDQFKLDSYVDHAEPVFIYEVMGWPTSEPFSAEEMMERINTNNGSNPIFDDPRLDEQWHYHNTGQTGGTTGSDISLFDAWEIETGDNDLVVQVLDTGIDPNHPDLDGVLWENPVPGPENGYDGDIHGWNFVNDTSNITDQNGHGSHVSGTIAARNNNGVGVAGVAGGNGDEPGVQIMTSRVFTGPFNTPGGFPEALVYGADNGAVISNNSWGGGGFSQVLRDAILYFIETAGYDPDGNPVGPMQGGLVIFAAGNSNVGSPNQPVASNPEVMAIAATNHEDKRSWYSQWGNWVHMSAPGGETAFTGDPEGVLSTIHNGNYQFYQGTSMAAPHVAGVAALIVSSFQDQDITPDLVFDRLVMTTDPIDDLNPSYDLGSGRLNALRALEQDDGIAPSAITDLDVTDNTQTSVTLTWTAPGSSGDTGVASFYDIRYSETPITDANFENATVFESDASPRPAGNTEEITIEDLDHSTTYYVAVKASDFFGNQSDLSNVAEAQTAGTPVVVFNPDELFGQSEEEGESAEVPFEVRNEGNDQLTFSITSFPEWLSFSEESGSVEAGETLELTATFDPDGLDIGLYHDEIVIENNSIDTPEVTLGVTFQVGDGSGELLISNTELQFGNVFVNGSSSIELSFQNIGSGPVEINSIESDNEVFELSANEFTVIPGSQRVLEVTFNPENEGPTSGTLTVHTDQDENKTFEISMSGSGAPAPEASFALEDQVLNLISGDTDSMSFTISNSSYQHLQYSISLGSAEPSGVSENDDEAETLSDWIQIEPSSGSVGSNTSVEGIITVDSENVEPGIYQAELMITTNDPLKETITKNLEIGILTNDEAYVQVIHNSADPELELVDVYVNDELLLESFSFQSATGYVTVEADRMLDISIMPAGSETTQDALYDINFEIGTGRRYTLVANGVLDPADFAGNPAETEFAVSMIETPVRSSDEEDEIAGFFFHGATDIESVDILTGFGDVLAEGLTPGEAGIYFSISADMQTFDLFEAGAANHFASFETDLSMHAGKAVTFLTTGFRYPANNMEGSEVSVMAVFEDGEVLMPQQATSGGDDITDIPNDFSLDQNYPNPFNPTTQITYALPEAGDVTLEVFNVQGQRVAVLVNGQQSAGTHTVTFDAERLSSGVYLYRIQSGSFSDVRKMMLVK